MSAALIVVTILGCDDGLTRCQYIDTSPDTYQTIALCDEALEADLNHYKYSEYASVVGVCRSQDEPVEAAMGGITVTGIPEFQAKLVEEPQPAGNEATPRQGNRLVIMTNATLEKAASILPERDQVRAVAVAPVNAVKGGYVWVRRRLGL